MAEYCKVCGIPLKASNIVDYRPGSCRDCELERKKLYSGISSEISSNIRSKKKSKALAKKVKKKKLRMPRSKRTKRGRKARKKFDGLRLQLKKERFLKAKKLKAAKLVNLKRLAKIRLERERKKKKLRAQVEKLRKLRATRALKLKILRRKQKERERRERERLKLRLKKAKERERKLLQKEREKLKKEKEKLRDLVRQEKERIRAEKRAEKEGIRAEKLRIKLEKLQEKERLKKAKEAAKQALIQAREAARQAAQDARRLREEAKKPPIVSIVTKVKEMQLPPDIKIVTPGAKEKLIKIPQPTKILDPKKPVGISGASSNLLQQATVIPAGANVKEEKDLLKQSTTAQHAEIIQRDLEKLQKETDPIIDRYNPYSSKTDPNIPRVPSPTPWLAPSFSVVKGDFQETKQEEGTSTSSGLTDQQVKDIIEKIKSEHKRK
jgi:hypothetical protein